MLRVGVRVSGLFNKSIKPVINQYFDSILRTYPELRVSQERIYFALFLVRSVNKGKRNRRENLV